MCICCHISVSSFYDKPTLSYRSNPDLSVEDIEASSLIQAILELNLSRLLTSDVIVMRMLLRDLFGSENSLIENSAKEQNLLKV